MSNRDAYQQKVEAQLKEWSAEIDKLKARAEKASADARIDANDAIADLRAKRREAERRLEEMRNAGEDAWGDVKRGFEQATESLSDSLRRARDRFAA